MQLKSDDTARAPTTGTALVVMQQPAAGVAPTAASKPRTPLRRHIGRMIGGAINTLAFAGIAVVGFSYAEQPWPMPNVWPRETAEVVAAPAPSPARPSATFDRPLTGDRPFGPNRPLITDRPLTTATLPDQSTASPAPGASKSAPIDPPVTEPAAPARTAPIVAAEGPTASASNSEPAPNTQAARPVPPRSTEPARPAHTQPVGETDYIAAVDSLLAPIRTLAVSIEDATHVRDAFAGNAGVASVRSHRDLIVDPTARKLVDWHLLRAGAGTGREIRAFLAANPDWPNRDLLTQRAEEYVFMTGGSAKDIKAFFADQEPKTAIGLAALASAHLAEQDEDGAYRLASKAWRTGDIPASLENGFVDRFGRLLKAEDHQWRLDRLLMDDQRWEGDRKDRAALVRRVIPFLSEPERAKANARLAVFLRAPDAGKLMAALPADAAINPKADWGFAFNLAQWHRRSGRIADARQILLDAPTDPSVAVSLDDWWEERRLAAYEALKSGDAKAAYALVKDAGAPLGVKARKDASFTAGWLALRHLADSTAAEVHFKDLEAAADGPQSRARAAWWLAKTYEARDDKAAVRAHYEQAAKHVDTFFGLLSMQALQPERTELKAPPPRLATQAEAEKFMARDAVKAVAVARRSGLDQSVTRALLVALRNASMTEPEHAMIAHLAEAIGDTQMSVRLAKASVARGFNLITYAYPIHPMPAYQPLRAPPEAAFLLGVARQESEFSQATKSGAGAKGLLQVMTITAQHVCKDYKITKCEIDRLMTDKAYNAMMGSAYLGDRMDEFTGSYVLTLAGYNAGPGRARQWIREFGDPRDPNVDPIDWINRIPFEETREYVQKVLSNVQIYRARLGDEANALRITQDLRRFAPSTRRAASVNAPSPAPAQN